MKTSMLAAACTFAAVLLSGCVTDAPRTSLRPGGTYDPEARVRAAEMESDRPVILMPYGMYGYPGPYYYGGFGYGGYGYSYPYGYGYGYGMPGPVILSPPHYHHRRPAQSSQTTTPNNPPKTFRDLFPGAKR